jgi:hypothetical protein
MGQLLAWMLIALIAPVLPSGDALPEAVFAVALGAVLCYLPLRASSARLEQVAWAAALIGVSGGLIRVPFLVGGYETSPASATWMAVAQFALLLLVLLMAPPLLRVLPWRSVLVLPAAAVAAATVICGALIVGVPDPQIDVFYFLNEGARGLLHGADPYAMSFTGLPPSNAGYRDPAYHFDVYSYLPGMLLLSLASVPLGDVRWLALLAVPVGALALYLVLAQAGTAQQTAAPANPVMPFVLRQAWPEPLIVAAFLLALWALTSGRLNWAVVAVVAVLSIKQYTPLLLVPLWATGLSLRPSALAAAVVLAISLPFIVWSPGDFWWDAVWYQVQAPQRPDAVSFNGYLLARFNASLPGWLTVAAPGLGAAYALWRAWHGRDWREVLRLTAGTYFLLFLFNKFAFANYYFLLQAMLLASGGVTLPRSPSPVEPAR